MAIVGTNDNDILVLPAAEPLLVDASINGWSPIVSDNGSFVVFKSGNL